MHSVGQYVLVVTDRLPDQCCEILRMDYGVANAVTIAGVHFKVDDFVRLNLWNDCKGYIRSKFAPLTTSTSRGVCRAIVLVQANAHKYLPGFPTICVHPTIVMWKVVIETPFRSIFCHRNVRRLSYSCSRCEAPQLCFLPQQNNTTQILRDSYL